MKIGSIVDATVTSVEAYGIYLEHENEVILVLIPEVSWFPSELNDCRKFTSNGNHIPVKILKYIQGDNCYLGSIKKVYPMNDPWVDENSLKVGSHWNGTVVHNIKGSTNNSYIVEIKPGVRGYLAVTTPLCAYKTGDRVGVIISKVDISNKRIQFDLESDG